MSPAPTGVVMQTLLPEWTRTALLHVLGYGLFAFVVTTGIAFVYREYSTRPIPGGAAVLLGVSIVGAGLNGQSLVTHEIVSGSLRDPQPVLAAYLLGAFCVSAVTAYAGRSVGDYFACDVFAINRLDAGGEVARLVRSAGLAVAVEVPETIEDAEGYAPVDRDVKRELAGRTLLFPRRLSVDELRSRIVSRVERDFGVGHAHVELSDEGEIEYLAVGDRSSGLGPSLPPGTVAVAVRGDPPADASTGDPVEVWTTDGGANKLVATGTLRGRTGDVATITVDADDADAFERERSYRLATRPDASDDVSELVSVIRVADETVTTVSVEAGGPLEGEFVGWLPVTVLVVERDGEPIPFPDENKTLRSGDTAYVLGTPAGLRQLAEYERDRERTRSETGTAPPELEPGTEAEADADAESEPGLVSKLTGR